MRRTMLLAVLAVLVLGCGTAPSEPLWEQTPLPLELRRVPRPVQLHYTEDGGTPGGPLTAHAWGGVLEPITPDSVRICAVWHDASETPSGITVVMREDYISGWYCDNGEEFEWPE